jgi:hypothetical protein
LHHLNYYLLKEYESKQNYGLTIDGIDPISNWFSSCSKSPALKYLTSNRMEYGQQKLVQTKATSRTRFGFFVEGGTFTMGKVEDDVMHDWNNAPTQQHVQSFTWMRQK